MHYDPVLCMNVPDKVTAKDAAVNEYEIHYTIPGKNQEMVGSGKGSSEAEAKADFLNYHKSENPKITSVKLYKKIKDSKTIDQAIRSCDRVTVKYDDAIGDTHTFFKESEEEAKKWIDQGKFPHGAAFNVKIDGKLYKKEVR